MTDTPLEELAHAIEGALTLENDLADRAVLALSRAGAGMNLVPADLDSTDKVLAATYSVLPGWAVSMKGAAQMPNGHWSCTLRRSASRDNDEVIGIGRGPTLPHALLAALLKVMALRN